MSKFFHLLINLAVHADNLVISLGAIIKYVRKIFRKTNISNPLIHTCVRIRGLEMLVFRKIFRTYLMDDPLSTGK